jgi:hypothetical protein
MMRNAQHQRPAVRFAHLVIAITPLFCRTVNVSSRPLERHDAYLRKNRQRGDRKQRGEEPAESVGEHAALDARVELRPGDSDAGDLRGCRDVTDRCGLSASGDDEKICSSYLPSQVKLEDEVRPKLMR